MVDGIEAEDSIGRLLKDMSDCRRLPEEDERAPFRECAVTEFTPSVAKTLGCNSSSCQISTLPMKVWSLVLAAVSNTLIAMSFLPNASVNSLVLSLERDGYPRAL